MKKILIIALAAIIGLGMMGCPTDSGTGETNVNQTPVVADFTINGLTATYDGSPKAVSVTPKAGKSTGQITVWYEGDDVTYDKSKTAPSAVGNYDVTFDVAAVTGFNAKAGLIAGMLAISGSQQNPHLSTPIAADFNISGLTATADGSPKAVNIAPKADKSTGQITIWYTGTAGTVYSRSNTAPSAAGNYAVTFDVAAVVEGFNAATGLVAGTLIIGRAAITDPHKIVDFETGWDSNGYTERAVSWGGFGWTVSGVVTTTDVNDRRDGEKSIRLRGNVGDNCRVQLDSYLTGIKAIHFDYASYGTHANGVIVLYSQIKGGDWVKVGEVTAAVWEGALQTAQFNVNLTNVRFKIAREGEMATFTSVNVDNIVIIGDSDASFEVAPVDPVADDFNISGLAAIYDGDPKEVSITPKAGKSQGDITVYYSGSTNAPSNGGNYAVTFDVAAAPGFNAVTGLIAGTLVIEQINDPHRIVDFEGDEWNSAGYTERTVSWGGFGWTVSGVVTTTDDNDRRSDTKSIRLRGNVGDNCRVQLDSYLSGIKAIHFDYASYSSHANGVIVLYSQIKGGDWVKVGEVTAPAWEGAMRTTRFNINVTDARFKIAREGDLANSTSVNVDNIVIIGDSDASFEIAPVDPVADDFNISGLSAIYDGDPKKVSITPKAGKSQGDITVYYDGSVDAPADAGSYVVTFDVTASAGYNAANGLDAGTLVIGQINNPHFVVDFETNWNVNAYTTASTITYSGHNWRFSGYGIMDNNDRRTGERSVRLRGNATDNVDGSGGHFIELTGYLSTGIKSISFDYASYSTHANGTLVLEYQIENSNAWTRVGEPITVPSWANGGSQMLNAHFDLNVTQSARFRIVKLSASGSTSVNIDNIIVTYTE